MSIFTSIISFLKDKSYRNLLFTTNFFIVLGTIVYHYIEGWSWLDTLYFSLITLTTIGYGDFSPQTDLGKIFTLLYIVIGVALILGFFNSLTLHFNNK
ncbi:MAG: potassium channel family protein [Flavobacteriales bacterium]|nr:potassium channel family protein [Flavobacteriales bacterium]